MKKSLASLTLFAATLGLAAGQAMAMPIVAAGPQSTYTVYVAGSQSEDAILAQTHFDGIQEMAQRPSGMTVLFDESETALDPNSSHISLNVSAGSDLFPAIGEDAVLGIGVDGDGLDLLSAVTLTDARITLLDQAGNVIYSSENLAGTADQKAPWDGTFVGIDNAFLVSKVGGREVASINFDFYVSQQQNDVPEPASLLLSGVGLLGLGLVRRRRKQPAA